MDEIFAQYYEDLLKAQYKVSQIVQQNLPKGTIREDFLRELVLKKKESLRAKKGMVSMGLKQSGECDLIFYDSSATINPIGDQIMIEPKHCRLILEIKSNATRSDLKKTNNNFQKIKEIDLENKPLCGLFCYNSKIEKKTVLKSFGWVFDEELKSWEENLSLEMKYLHIDFMVCIACLEEDEEYTEHQFFLVKDRSSQRFVLKQEYPIIKNFFAVTDNL